MNRRKPAPVAPPAPAPSVEIPALPKLALTIDEAAVVLCCGRTTIYELIKAGKLKTCPVGRKKLVAVVEVQRFLSESAA